MAVTFDDLIPAPPGGAPPSSGPTDGGAPPAAAPPMAASGGVSFDDLIPSSGGGGAPSGPGGTSADPASKAPWTLGEALLPSMATVNGAVRAAANAVPVVGAYADKLDAATDSAISGKSADKAMADQKAQDATFAAQSPVASGTAGFAGAAGGSVAMLPEWGLGMVGGLGSRVVGSTVGGTTLGTADAMARGDDPASGAIGGAVSGALGPVVAKGVGAGIRGVTGLMQGAPSGVPNTGRIAAGWLRDGVAGMSPEDYEAAKAAAGPAGIFADLNPALTDYAGSVADNNSAGKQVVRDAYQGRMDARNGRVNALVDQNLGPAQSPVGFAGALDDQAKPFAQAQGEAIRNAGPVDVSGPFNNLRDALPNTAPGSPEHAAYGQAVTMLGEQPRVAPPSTWEPDPVGSGQTPEMPPNLPEPPPYTDTPAPTRPGPVGVPRPQDLHAFVRSLGGIQDRGGDLAAMGYDNLVARPGQGLGADAMRQAAAQMGYLNHTVDGTASGATRFSTVNDLLDALGSDNPIYSPNDDDAVHAWAARDAAMADYQQRGGAGADPTARAAGPRPSAPGVPFSGDPGFDPNAPTGLMATTNAAKILSARKALDDRINYSGPTTEAPSSALRSQQGAYQQARAGLSQALKDQVPGYADATDALAGIARQRDALNDGLDALGSGRQAVRPDDFATMFAALSPEEQAAYRVGMRANVDQALGTRANDFSALKGLTQGENGWNGQKLGTAFGPDAAGAVNTGIGQEEQIARNTQKVIGGSPTGEKVQRSRLTQPGGRSEGLLGAAKDWWNDLYIDKPSTYLPLGQIGGRVMSGAFEQARDQIAPHLVKPLGPETDALFAALQAQAQRKAALAPPAAADPLVQALMLGAGQYARQ